MAFRLPADVDRGVGIRRGRPSLAARKEIVMEDGNVEEGVESEQ
jgi:hypothetical protein